MNPKDLYRESGVDVEKGDKLVDWLKKDADNLSNSSSPFGQVIAGIGGFASLFRPNFKKFKDPLLVSGTDGVGTKLLLGLSLEKLDTLGIDLVAMCINDIYTLGAHPLFFIDYFATGKLDENQFKSVLNGIKKGLEPTGAFLIGGETAELPGLYQGNHFDLAGFIVGVADGANLPDPKNIQPSDTLIALHSSGFHSNGFSLLRKWLKDSKVTDPTLLGQILTPTTIYHKVPEALEKFGSNVIHGVSHITGGGISGNLTRVMPNDTEALIDLNRLPMPSWMKDFILLNTDNIMNVEKSFNLGCGMVLSVDKNFAEKVLTFFKDHKTPASIIGSVEKGTGKPTVNYK